MGNQTLYLAIAILAVIVLAAVAYYRGWLNKILPKSMEKKDNFVGAFGRTPEMQHCLAFSGPGKRWSYFNRCTWV
ncbi:MAG: hypothetical protein WC700_04120 [Gemmatimonadaceae bacterium]|jgi:hypothetical protein